MSHFAEVFQRISYYEDRIFGALWEMFPL
jgi:hypothetical protein